MPTTTAAEIVTSDDPLAEGAYERAREALRRDRHDEAQQLLEDFLTRWPDDPLAPPARVSLAWLYLENNALERAAALLTGALSHPDPVLAERARLYMGVLEARGQHPEESISLLAPLVGRTVRPQDTALLLSTLATAHEGLGQNAEALSLFDRLFVSEGDEQTRREAMEGIERTVAALTVEESLNRAWEELPRNRLAWQKVSVRVLRSAYERAEFDRVAEIAKAMEEQNANLDEKLRALVLRAERAGSVDPGVIGAILPLSGNGARAGQSAQLGLMLAAGMPGTSPSTGGQPKVVYRDDQGDPARAVKMVEELTSLHRVIAIVGPMSSASASAAARKAQELGVPLIALSPLQSLTEIGDHVFRIMPSSRSEARMLVDQAVRKGARRFAIIHPRNGYGEKQRQNYAARIAEAGGEVVASASYPKTETNFGPSLEPLAGVDFDALIVPDGPRLLQLLVPALVKQGLWQPRGFPEASGASQLLLPSIAFHPSLLQTTWRYLQGAVFLLPSAPESAAYEDFSTSFEETFGKPRNRFSAYAHDAYTQIESALASGDVRTRNELMSALGRTRNEDAVAASDGFGVEREPLQAGSLAIVNGPALAPLED